VLIHLGQRFPYIHDLVQLLGLIEQTGQPVPESIKRAAILSEYAVETRYPGLSEPVTRQEYEEAVAIAAEVVHWAEEIIGELVEPDRD
jgi:HEPN domain-containing protein